MLTKQGVEPKDFNSYGSRRGNHEVDARHLANIRIKNEMLGGEEGGIRFMCQVVKSSLFMMQQCVTNKNIHRL